MLFARNVSSVIVKLANKARFRNVNNAGGFHRQPASHISFRSVNVFPYLGVRNFAVVREPLESLGDSITTAVLLSWSKVAGDAVKEDDVIAVVETDKVTMDIRAKKSGVLVEALAAAGAEVSVGGELYVIDTSANAVSAVSPVPATAMTPSPTAAVATGGGEIFVVPVPAMGESITQGVLANWSSKVGDSVNADDVVASIETDKVTVEVRSPHAGTISKLYSNEGDEVNVSSPLFDLIAGAGRVVVSNPPAAVVAAAPVAAPKASATAAPPAALAKPAAASKPTPSSAASSVPPITGARVETRVKMTRMRLRIAQRLKEAQNTAAMLTTFQEVDMGHLMDLRNKHKEEFEKVHGIKLGFMSAFVKASTKTLLEIPAVNAIIDDNSNEIVYREYVDISVAVASPNGLVVPVLRNTEKMSFADVEKTIAAYGKKAKEGTLSLEEMTGGTFTISNGGVFGSLLGTPIINPPQSAILGMHATKLRPVVTADGKIEARPMMYLALTYDHRLIDGREAVTFLKSVAAKIEDPARLILDL